MTYDFAALKAETRRVVQDTLAVDATYKDSSMSEPAPIKARLKAMKIDAVGDLGDDGYAQIVQGVDRIVLIPEDFPEVTFRSGGVVAFTAWGLSYTLDVLEPDNGPLSQVWRVSAL